MHPNAGMSWQGFYAFFSSSIAESEEFKLITQKKFPHVLCTL
jgi:hypothetical protein